MKKLTQEEFIERASSLAKRPVNLSQFIYRGTTSKGTAICPAHGAFQITAGVLLTGAGCKKCGAHERGENQRHTTDTFIAKARKVHGDRYDYSQVAYVAAKHKVAILCSEHGLFYQGANQHLLGQGCPKCGDEHVGKISRVSQEEFVAAATKIHGDKYDLSEVVYQGRTAKIKVICKIHGPFFPRAGNFTHRKSGCPSCATEAQGLMRRRKESSYIAEAVKVHGGRFSYGKVTSRKGVTMMRVICPVHGMFEQNAQDHLKGVGCTKCSRPVSDQESFLSRAHEVHGDKYDYSLSEYSKALEKVTIICPTHGKFQQTPSCHISAAQGCPTCGKYGPSYKQIEVAEFLRTHTETVIEYSFDDTRRKLDIFMPEYNLAVEYHGLIWHSTAYATDPLKDFKKHVDAAKQGIRVIHIYEDEWLTNREVVERLLLSSIGQMPRVFARKTSVVDVDAKTARSFIDRNHIQGCSSQPSECYLGLVRGEELIACMAFGASRNIRRNADSRFWELQRYASSVSVVGGASKLLKAFLKRDLCHTLVSYSDTRLFSGAMYIALGFELEHETRPDYCYINNNTKIGRVHKSNFQRKHLPNKLETFDPNKTEVQNCIENGWYQLFDCGKKKWSLTCK